MKSAEARICPTDLDHHLKVGTQAENGRDMVRRDRQRRGERNGQAKLTREDVLAIRASDRPSRALAEEYGVSPSHIRRIKTGGSWSIFEKMSFSYGRRGTPGHSLFELARAQIAELAALGAFGG